ncbi:LuxR C-terminal-related transcriptional regulator [Rubrimonas cliftonensis]|uniref:Two component transcriptional regulator, LuxR family n=1 Tax=Rubrimonas cliftonensis TaxID=89524 RepID=A0A1H4G5A6_9RHOB|nr:response regulator transcription factor [Rubrimonas cliftonensis]SEB04803.1 two component transcriptional regulator, LuxR family [Rubrimonas cliftonensis]
MPQVTPTEETPRPCRVLVVEDQPHAARHLAQAVDHATDLHLVGVAGTLEQGLALLERTQPRVVLVDLGLPDGSGLDLIRVASRVAWPCDSIVISVFADDRHVVGAIEAGAIGYLQKATRSAEVARAIDDALAGGSPISPGVARRILRRVARGEPAQRKPCAVPLSSREHEVLQLVSEGLQRREIAEALGIAIGTVGNHIHSIYRKLQVASNTGAVSAARRLGLL